MKNNIEQRRTKDKETKFRGDKMLETMRERVKLLKAGISGKRIEYLYVIGNNMKIVNLNLLHIDKFSMVPK